MVLLSMQETRELNIGGLTAATTYIARVQTMGVSGTASHMTSILFTTPLLQTGANGSLSDELREFLL